MGLLKTAWVDLASRYREIRHGARVADLVVDDRIVPVQSFNALGRRNFSDTAVVFLPGFDSIPITVSPGVIGAAAANYGADFVRFYHPDLLNDPSKMTYGRLVKDAVAVVESLPHDKVILTGASFGAGMMPLVADKVNADRPGKVAGMFGWCSVPPAALLDLFKRQDGWIDIVAGCSDVLKVVSPTMSKPFFMSQAQLHSVRKAALYADHLKPFEGQAMLYTGEKDPVGLVEYSRLMLQQMKVNPVIVTIFHKHGHKMPPEKIRRGVEQVLMLS